MKTILRAVLLLLVMCAAEAGAQSTGEILVFRYTGSDHARQYITGTGSSTVMQRDAGGALVFATVTNAQLANSTISINGSAISLGGSVANLQTTNGALALAGFSGITGTVPAANGGFGADVSGGSGVPLFAAGVATFTSTTGTGNFVRASSPTITTPTISGAMTLPDGVRQTFNPDGTSAGLNVGAHTSDPASPTNGDVYYDSDDNLLRARINGAWVSLGAGGGAFDPASPGAIGGTTPAAGTFTNLRSTSGSLVVADPGTGSGTMEIGSGGGPWSISHPGGYVSMGSAGGVTYFRTDGARPLAFGFAGTDYLKFVSQGSAAIFQMQQASSLGTPDANTGRIGVKDVAGTAEMFVVDEAGNETQISPHNHTAPASFVDNPFDEIGYTANFYTGVVVYTNKQRQRAGRADFQFVETFAQHNARLGLTGAAVLVERDWATVQQGFVTAAQALHDAWQARKTAWEGNAANAGKPFTEVEPALYVAKAVPAWLTAQLSGRADYLTRQAGIVSASAGLSTKRTNVKDAVTALRSWKVDADTAVAAWDGWTTAQRFAAMKTVVQRFGTLSDRLADLIEGQGIGQQ